MESNKPQTLMLLGIHLLLVFALSAHGHAASDHDNVIDLLAALNMSNHVSGVIRLQSPSGVVYRIRPRAPHLTLPPEYSQFLHSNFQGCMGVHFAGNQSTGSGGTLLSLSSLSSPILQIISSSLNKSLRVDYQAGGGGGRAQDLASLLFPKRNPFSWENWVQLAVSLEPDRLVFFVDCQEPIVVPIKSEERFNLELPQNVVITLASTPRRKVSKFSGHLKTADISMKAYLRRPWLCDNITDILPPSQCSDVKKSGSQIDSSQTFKPDAPNTKTQTSHHQQDVQSDQLQRGVVLGPPATPQGVKSVSQSDDRLKKLEERIEELARMLDMVKAQNVGLQSRINYLEGCECVRGQCEWEGREVDEGQSWQIDLSTICTCTSGKVTCQPNIKDPCLSSPCQNGGVCFILTSDPEGFHCSCPPNTNGPLCHTQLRQACFVPKPENNCEDVHPSQRRWTFNPTSGLCEDFLPCSGNSSNNFPSFHVCKNHCILGACCFRTPKQGVPVVQQYYTQCGYNISSVNKTLWGYEQHHFEDEMWYRDEDFDDPEPEDLKGKSKRVNCCKDLDFTYTCDYLTLTQCQALVKEQAGETQVVSFSPGVKCSDVRCGGGCGYFLRYRESFKQSSRVNHVCQHPILRKEIRDLTVRERNLYQRAIKRMNAKSGCDVDGTIHNVSHSTDGSNCEGGNRECTPQPCPSLDCTQTETVSGECCQQCRGCIHSGVRYDHKAEWRSEDNPCDICYCLEGNVRCTTETCLTPCNNPVAPAPNTCCPICEGCGVNGHEFPNGAVIPTEDSCQECICVNGNVVCSALSCPSLSCHNPVQSAGDCCPRCEQCEYESKVYMDGQKFTSQRDPCLLCRCSAGEVSCERIDASCPPLACTHPAQRRGQCCPTCDLCEYDRRVYADGKVFRPAGSGPCLQCRCKGGNVICHEERCPPAQCSRPVIDPQRCCPICKVCVLEGVEYEEGSSWHLEEPCSSCTCVNGEALCTHKQCPPHDCLHPTKTTGSCCATCDSCTYNRRIYSNGQRFTTPEQPCHICTCQHGTVKCERRPCPSLSCANSYTPPGECCPKCPDCSFENHVFVDGEAFPNPVNSCEQCKCVSGKIDCEQPQCPQPHCNSPRPGRCCQNNCNGCSYAGKEYPNGMDFPHPTDTCRTCSCINGNVQCLMKRCPPLQCSSPNLVSGECCPQCPAPPSDCMYEQRPYRHAERFYHPTDHCRSCVCTNGTVQCQRRPCPFAACSHPIKQDCCPTCEGCLYEGRERANGESWDVASDPCAVCMCRDGSVHCERKRCPPANCRNPVQRQCCMSCDGCMYHGKEYADSTEFADDNDPCGACYCYGGEVICSKIQCYEECSHPYKPPGQCCGECERCYHNSVVLINGQSVPDPGNPCSECTCQSGSVHCVRKPCPAVHCPHPVTNPCGCPVCDGCQFQGVTYVDGQTVPGRERGCKDCTCSRGEVVCAQRRCPTVSCTHPALDGCECGVCDGCNFNGRDCFNGERFPHPTDHCQHCTCVSGSVHCVRKPCPAVHCPHPVTNPCGCPVCDGCQFQGVTYVDGQTVPGRGNGCQDCTCSRGEVVCTQRRCPTVSCTHPALDGCECGVCEGCNFNGRDCFNGEQFPHPTDHCQHCTCVSVPDPGNPCSECTCQSGSVHCVRKPCPAVHCPHPATNPCGCPVCDGCQFQGVTYVDGQTVPGRERGCKDCTCSRGEVVCAQRRCPTVSCTHPALDGCECGVCDGCNFNGRDCFNGERFPHPTDHCQHCTCVSGSVHCVRKPCPAVHCPHPVTNPCGCPVCDGCQFQGVTYVDGQTVPGRGNGCQDCTCSRGEVVCTQRRCPTVSCTHPALDGCECGVCEGCNFNGRDCFNGEQFPHPTDHCQHCTCVSGSVHCVRKPCPAVHCPHPVTNPCGCPVCDGCQFQGVTYVDGQTVPGRGIGCQNCTCSAGEVLCDSECTELPCMHQVTDPGACCPRCRGCMYEGEEHTEGSNWFADSAPCMSCMCVEGVTTCSEVHCLSPCVNFINVPGECCPMCADCIFEGRVYGPGDSFHPADDPCQICTCEVMPDGEQHLMCYRKQCPSLVDCPKSNILFSGPDSCCPVCAQPLSNCTSALIGNEVLATDDPCFTCSCQDLTWTCLHQMCQPPSCPLSEQFMPPDSCCPVCKDCVIEGQKSVANGSIWTDSDDDCVTCTCNLGHIECSIEECRPVVCVDGQKPVKLPGKCCSECPVRSGGACLYHGTEYHCNEQWKLDECTTCTCVSGDVHCHHERCPPLTCATDEMPAVIPGLCCPHCLPRPATCIAFGDPHYRTFDGRMLHFQGACTYVLAQDCDDGDFSIHVTNDDRGRKGVSWTKEVTVYIGDVTVQLLQDWVVKVNNDVVELPFLQEPYIYIERQTNTILLNTNIGLKVLWSGRSHLEVSVPGSYKGQICGLCGNFNGYYHDDLRMAGGGISLSEADFGNSWRVTNGSHYASSCRPGEDVDPCKDAGYQAKKGANARCRVLKSAAFKPCHRVVPPEPWYGACVYDLCACGASSDECLCDALEAYASQCREAGVILQWRSPSLCAVGCPLERGFVFDECGPPCPKTCFNVDVPLGVIESHCFKPCVPGCQCPAGLVLHNNYCIQPEKCPKIIHDKDT